MLCTEYGNQFLGSSRDPHGNDRRVTAEILACGHTI